MVEKYLDLKDNTLGGALHQKLFEVKDSAEFGDLAANAFCGGSFFRYRLTSPSNNFSQRHRTRQRKVPGGRARREVWWDAPQSFDRMARWRYFVKQKQFSANSDEACTERPRLSAMFLWTDLNFLAKILGSVCRLADENRSIRIACHRLVACLPVVNLALSGVFRCAQATG